MADENNEENSGAGEGDAGNAGNAENAGNKAAEGNQNDGGDGGKQAATENWYGDDWRQQLAGDDEKTLKGLGKFKDPAAMLTSYHALEQKLATGETRGKLPENYSDEDLAIYREANGIPAEADGYFKDMPDGLVIGDEDKSLFESYGQMMHDLNVDPKVAQSTAAWYYEAMETQQAEQHEADENQRKATEDNLRVSWDTDYRANLSTLDAYLEQAPEEVSDFLTNARAADGTPLMTKPAMLEWLADKARNENPFITPVPNQGQHGGDWKEEQAALIKESANPDSDYRKGPKDADGRTKGEARLLELNRYELRIKAQAA